MARAKMIKEVEFTFSPIFLDKIERKVSAKKKVTKTAKKKATKPAKKKAVTKKVVKKAVTKKPTKKAVTKKKPANTAAAVKRAKKAVAKVIKKQVEAKSIWKKPNKNNPLPHIRVNNVSISATPTEKYPTLVTITRGPSRYEDLIGRKYLNHEFAEKAILTYQAEALIAGGKGKVRKELLGLGIGIATDYTDVDLSNIPHEKMIALQDKVMDQYEA